MNHELEGGRIEKISNLIISASLKTSQARARASLKSEARSLESFERDHEGLQAFYGMWEIGTCEEGVPNG